MKPAQEELIHRERNAVQEERERRRYQILKGVYERGSPARERPVRALDVGLTLGISREEVFRTVLELTHRRYLSFCSAGPQVRITPLGVEYIERGAGRRRSIREA